MVGVLRSPESLLRDGSLQAQVLSVSDNHATILLRPCFPVGCGESSEGHGPANRSLLKMNVVPTHREYLASSLFHCSTLEELNNAEIDELSSRRILGFLQNLDYRLSSESGAEYSYYTASQKTWWQNPLGSLFKALQQPKDAFKVELISPASDRQIERSLPTPAMALVEETPEMYESIVRPYIQKLVEDGSLSWIQNVVDGKKETERLLLNRDTYILNIDTKWKTHPDAKTVPREQWYGHKSVEDLYCLAIVKDSSLRDLRDLRGHHVSMLLDILRRSRDAIERIYGVPANQLRIYFHYPPQFYHLHVHFTRIENEIGCQVERGHLLSDVLQNLALDPNYYTKRSITYKLKTSSELYSLIRKQEG